MLKFSRMSTGGGWQLLALTVLLAGPLAARAQSVDLVQAYQRFEAAKSDHRVADALASGDDALRLTAAEGGTSSDIEQLCLSLGELAAEAGEDQQALPYYQRALSLQEAELGANHPDLVPTLSALAHLQVKAQSYEEAEATLKRILDIERQAFGPQHENVLATLDELRGVYQAANNLGGVAEVDAELQAARTKRRGLTGIGGKLVVDSKRYAIKDGYATVRVFYGTNRVPTGEQKPALIYGKASGTLQYGYLDVTIPQTHQLAELESPKEWSDYTLAVNKTEMRRKYVLLDSVTPLSRDSFTTALRQQIGASPSKDVFVFIHGYNNSFEDTARRAAQLAYDLDFDGTPIMYSWPSQARLTGYFADQDMIEPSGPRLAEFLDTITAQSGAERVHLLAHSMGNRVMLAALKTYLAKHPLRDHRPAFGQLVFTAPDVDRAEFVEAFKSLHGIAERTTLYASDSDYALRVSRIAHGAPRAGAAGDGVIRLAGLDTIDMSGLPADALGHSYFAASDGAVYDLLALLWRGDPPNSPQRCSKSAGKGPGAAPLWRFNVDKCKGSDLLEAGVLLKEYRDQRPAQIVAQVQAQIASFSDPTQRQAGALVLARLNGLLGSVK